MNIVDCFYDVSRQRCCLLLEEMNGNLLIVENVFIKNFDIEYRNDKYESGGIWSPSKAFYTNGKRSINLSMTADSLKNCDATTLSEWYNLKGNQG